MKGLRIAGRVIALWLIGSLVGVVLAAAISVPFYALGADDIGTWIESASLLWIVVGIWLAVVVYRRRYGPISR